MKEPKYIQLFKSKSIPLVIIALLVGTVCWLINLLGFVLIKTLDTLSLIIKTLNNAILDVPTRNLVDGYKILFSRIFKK